MNVMVSGKLLSGKSPLRKFPPFKLPLVNSPQENSYLENSHPGYSYPYFSIFPPGFLKFFPLSLLSPLSLILVKNGFVIPCSKSQNCCTVSKNLTCRPKWLHTHKSFAGQSGYILIKVLLVKYNRSLLCPSAYFETFYLGNFL